MPAISFNPGPAYNASVSTAPETNQIGPSSGVSARPPRSPGRMVTVLGSHAVVDFFSFVPIAMLPLLVTEIGLSNRQKALLLGLGSMTSGLIQPLVAWVSDRFNTRALSTIGFGLAVVCVSNLGRVETFWQLMVLHGLGAAGIGAFHPPAAAATGQMAGRKRALGMGFFFVLGMSGGFLGNVLTPSIVGWFAGRAPDGADAERFGLLGLSWLMIPGLLAVVLLGLAITRAPHRRHDAHEHHTSLGVAERRRRWFAVGVLYVGNLIRFSVNVALIYLFSEWAEELVLGRHGLGALPEVVAGMPSEQAAGVLDLRGQIGREASSINGPLQGAMQVGMGGMGLLLGAVLGARFERLAFVGFPMLGAVVIAVFPWLSHLSDGSAVPMALGLAVLAGVGFGSVIPVSLTAAQRLLPHRTSLASGMMLGGAWAFAFVGPLWAEGVQKVFGLSAAFYVTAAILFLAGLLSLAIPSRVLIETDHHEKQAS
ncbi:MAG: MFS family permease [Phycisphaerales bacterium]|jgi:MFS family permease